MAKRTPQDGYPVFRDGDVEILLSRKPEDRFVLHSVVLGLHSSFFKVSISERWSARNDDATSDDPIKWRYQLLFEDDMSGEEIPLLAKAKPEVSSVSGSSDLSPDTASIFLMHAPHVPSNDRKTRSRLASIRAHRHYLDTLYHKTSHFVINKFRELVDTMVDVLRLADIYGSHAIFEIPVETAFGRLKSRLDRSCSKHYFDIIYIATLARSAWLFKYIICRLVGDPTCTDNRIKREFDTLGVVPLILKKRSKLRETMLRIDHTIMFVEVPVSGYRTGWDEHTVALATAAYKHHLLENLKEYYDGGWKLSSEKYRVLKEQYGWWNNREHHDYDRLLNMFGPINVDESDFKAVIDSLRRKVAHHVSPLLVDHADIGELISNPWPAKRKNCGLTCVKITYNDLPWKDVFPVATAIAPQSPVPPSLQLEGMSEFEEL